MTRVAVVIPAFNPGRYLTECVASALAQTVNDIEVIVIDDGSTEALPVLPVDDRLRVIRQENQGVSAARNLGVEETSAPIVAFLDADDRWAREKLERQLAALAERPEAVACYTNFRHINDAGEPVGAGNATSFESYSDLLGRCPVPLSSAVASRKAFVRVGGFDLVYSIVADWDLWLRLSRVGPFLFVDEPLMDYRVANHNIGQMSGDPMRAFKESSSVLDRQAIAAHRVQDERTLALLASGRSEIRRLRAGQAAARFVDSVGRRTEWAMLRTAFAIEPRVAIAAIGSRAARRGKRALRLPTT